MPSLHHLSASSLSIHSHVPSLPRNTSNIFFPSLHELLVRCITFDLCGRLLQAFNNPDLIRRLNFGYEPADSSAAEVEQFVTLVGDTCVSTSLFNFVLTLTDVGEIETSDLDETAYRVTQEMLRPLLQFSKLRHCHVVTHILDYDDSFVKAVALAFPNLVTLTLLSIPKYQAQSKLTMRCFYYLARCCPKLEDVKLNRLNATGLGIITVKRTWDHGKRVAVLPALGIWVWDADVGIQNWARDVA
ncbi:hypothetical protein EVG20_g9341 [Dentipellis fragilis]|uniref:Uncharacterized protein n=1 Tax=Dentipellis fragilis TaxID=205917 RepID=A0A4Y9XYP5_9AGAM|nr:hypothetical protein EVG20_g9341 [Dentipellis fragilis]